jgi:hypothetical protein
MGSRANLVVVGELGVELYASDLGAQVLDRELFFGPEPARAYIRRQVSQAQGAAWLDDLRAEGGVLMDLRAWRLVWFQADVELPRRRLLLELMRMNWPGWQVIWADEGLCTIADELRLPRAQVLSPEQQQAPPSLEPPRDPGQTDSVLTARKDDGTLVCFPLAGDVSSRLQDLDALAAAIERAPGAPRLDLAAVTRTFPQSGAHVDLARREVGFWSANEQPSTVARLIVKNPGWRVVWRSDRFEWHLHVTDGALTFPPVVVDEALGGLKATMVADPAVRSEDRGATLSVAERERLWTKTVEAWRARR